MRWEDERYVRLYTRDTPEWTLLSWEARCLFTLLLRGVDRAGLMELGRSGLKGVASLLRMPLPAVERAMPELLDDGCVAIHGDVLAVRNFIEAQEANQSDAARKRTERERARDKARAAQLGLFNSGDSDRAESRIVTDPSENGRGRHTASQPVTPNRAVPSQLSKKEETKNPVSEPIPEPVGSASCPDDSEAPPSQPPTVAPCEEPPTSHAAREPRQEASVPRDDHVPVDHLESPAMAPQRPGNGLPTLFALMGPQPGQPEPPRESPNDPAQEIFDEYIVHWRRTVGARRAPVLDEKRRKLVKGRIRDGFTVDELKRACAGVWRSAWHVEQKQYDFSLVLRDASHVERFMALAPTAKVPTFSAPSSPALDPEIAATEIPESAKTAAGASAHLRQMLDNLAETGLN